MIKQVIATPNCTHIFIVYIHVGAVQRNLIVSLEEEELMREKKTLKILCLKQLYKRKRIVPVKWVRYIKS